jgi:hypothetical protein
MDLAGDLVSPATYLLLALALCTSFGIVALLIPREPPGAVMPPADHHGRHRTDDEDGDTVRLAESRLRHIER